MENIVTFLSYPNLTGSSEPLQRHFPQSASLFNQHPQSPPTVCIRWNPPPLPLPTARPHLRSGCHTSVMKVQSKVRKQAPSVPLDCNIRCCILKGFLQDGMIPFGVEVSKLQIINKEQAFQTFQRFCSVKPGAVRRERARTAPCWKLPAATRLGPTRTLLRQRALRACLASALPLLTYLSS